MRNRPLLLLFSLSLAACAPAGNESAHGMSISSPAFADGAAIPVKYTCDGENINPPLAFHGVPKGAMTLSLRVIDPDARNFTHWSLDDMPPYSAGIEENVKKLVASVEKNDFGAMGYGGPCPPHGKTHHYVFNLVAKRGQQILAKATLTGTFTH